MCNLIPVYYFLVDKRLYNLVVLYTVMIEELQHLVIEI